MPQSVEPTRQIHLDFHTSEHIPGVGARFDKGQFIECLRTARVNQINLFAKCHHSWCYYPTRMGKMHPSLTFDLLGAQIEACHANDIRAPIYLTVGWSARDAEEHPEWCQRERDGRYAVTGGNTFDLAAPPAAPRPVCSWKFLCVNTPYGALVEAHVAELCEAYSVDGLWLDIYQVQRPCYCADCLRGMRAAGIDPDDPEGALRYRSESVLRHQARVREILHARHPNATLFFNGTTNTNRRQNLEYAVFRYNTKLDLEDLPTTWGGYDKLPLRARLFHVTGKPLVAMSGKFHTMWGEFGGFKHRDALRYEAAAMLASGCRVNFGDQAHPAAYLEPATYSNIAHAFAYVDAIEEFAIPGRPLSDIALWFTAEPESDEGVAKMLLETQHEFEVVRSEDGQDLARYRLLILPSATVLSVADTARVEAFIAGGGRVLAVGVCAPGNGADSVSPATYQEDYTRVGKELADDLPPAEFRNYKAGLRFAPRPGTTILAQIFEPYFDRTYGRYCSHQNTPNRLDPSPHPAAFRAGNVLTLAHPLDQLYYHHGARVHRQLFRNALRLLLPDPMLDVTMPSAGRATLLAQPHARRHVTHLLYACPMKRGRCEIIEDIVPLRNIPVTVRLPVTPQRATLVPGRQPLFLEPLPDGAARVIVPEFTLHGAVVWE